MGNKLIKLAENDPTFFNLLFDDMATIDEERLLVFPSKAGVYVHARDPCILHNMLVRLNERLEDRRAWLLESEASSSSSSLSSDEEEWLETQEQRVRRIQDRVLEKRL